MKLLILLLIINCNGLSVRKISNKVKRQLEPNFLCNVGPSPLSDKAEVSSKAGRGVVYVDTTRPATCGGNVHTIETCFRKNDDIAEEFSFDLIHLRPHRGGYRLQLALTIPTNEIIEDENSYLISLYCQNITIPSGAFTVRKGDFIGFRSWNNIEIAFTFFPFEGSLQSVRLLEPVLGVETVLEDDLAVSSSNDSELAMFRVFIVDDGLNTVPATPGDCPTSSTSNAGNEPGGGGPDLGFNNIYNISYTSFVIGFIVAIVIVFILALTVLGMGMSMCKGPRKCLKKICCRKGKNKNKFKELSGDSMNGSTTL